MKHTPFTLTLTLLHYYEELDRGALSPAAGAFYRLVRDLDYMRKDHDGIPSIWG